MRDYMKALETQVALVGRERLVIGGNLKSNIGRQNARNGVCGKYG